MTKEGRGKMDKVQYHKNTLTFHAENFFPFFGLNLNRSPVITCHPLLLLLQLLSFQIHITKLDCLLPSCFPSPYACTSSSSSSSPSSPSASLVMTE